MKPRFIVHSTLWDEVHQLFDLCRNKKETAYQAGLSLGMATRILAMERPVEPEWYEEMRPFRPGQMIRIARELAGYSLKQLAALADVNLATLHYLEVSPKSRNKLNWDLIKNVCEVLQISVEDIILGEPNCLAPAVNPYGE